jgi:hypothetical protein
LFYEIFRLTDYRITVFYNNFAFKNIAFGVFAENTGIGFGIVVFNPQVIIFPCSTYVTLAVRNLNSHYTAIAFDKNLLEMKAYAPQAIIRMTTEAASPNFHFLALMMKPNKTAAIRLKTAAQ